MLLCWKSIWPFFFCKNLVDFNEACMHEVTLNLYMHAWIFSCLSIASVLAKQHLSEVVFSALVGFSMYTTSTHHRVKQLPKSTTGMSSVAYVMLCGARDRSCGQQAIGASIMTMLQHIPCTSFRLFWWKSRLLWFARLLTLVIRFPAASWYSPNSRGHWKGNPTIALNTTSLKCCLPSTDAIHQAYIHI